MPPLIDLTDQTFTRLTVQERGPNSADGRVQWWCVCTCGNRCLVTGKSLTSRHTKSCGCLHQELLQILGYTHHLSTHPEYMIWLTMKQRCLNPRRRDFGYYGGRGITICNRWLDDFPTFLADMGPRPSPKHSLDRFPDQDGPYNPENCRWATAREQGRNMRSNRLMTLDGSTACVTEWAHRKGLLPSTVLGRLRRGWSDEKALNTPRQTQGRRDLR